MPDQTEPTGHDRRADIRALLRASTDGWMFLPDIASELELDRSTIYHHAKIMVTEGTAALGRLRYIGEGGRPPTVLIDLDRIHDLDTRFTLQTTTGTDRECELTISEAPDEWDRNPAAMGPVSRALRDGALTDQLAAAIVQTVSKAILSDLRNGRTRLVIEAVTPELLDTPDTTESGSNE